MVIGFSLFPSHPEKPERISRIYDKHREWGILDRCLNVKVSHPKFIKLFFMLKLKEHEILTVYRYLN